VVLSWGPHDRSQSGSKSSGWEGWELAQQVNMKEDSSKMT
jgi:hypothetical protein